MAVEELPVRPDRDERVEQRRSAVGRVPLVHAEHDGHAVPRRSIAHRSQVFALEVDRVLEQPAVDLARELVVASRCQSPDVVRVARHVRLWEDDEGRTCGRRLLEPVENPRDGLVAVQQRRRPLDDCCADGGHTAHATRPVFGACPKDVFASVGPGSRCRDCSPAPGYYIFMTVKVLTEEACVADRVAADRLARLRDALPDSAALELAETFRLLTDPGRLRLIAALLEADELCVCDLADVTGLSQTACSHNLRLLRAQRLVRYRNKDATSTTPSTTTTSASCSTSPSST